MIDRRTLLVLTGAAGLAAACGGPPGPSVVNLAFTGASGMNPGPDGADRPVTVQVLRLRDAGALAAADMYGVMRDPAGALGAALVGVDQVAVPPGGSAAKAISVEPEAVAVGLVALLREPDGRVWRTSFPVSPGSTIAAAVTLGPGGLAVSVG